MDGRPNESLTLRSGLNGRWRFVASCGVNVDLAVAKVDRSCLRDFKDALIELKLSTASIKKQLGAVRTVLGWAVEVGLVDHNVAAGVGVRDAKVQREARSSPYADGDLKVLFGSPIYTAGDRPGGGGGEASYWLPLMALYMGGTIGGDGVCLQAFDVLKVGGALCLDINDERR